MRCTILDVKATLKMLRAGIGKNAVSSERPRTSSWSFIADRYELSPCSRTTEQFFYKERLFNLLEEIIALQHSIGLFNKLTKAA